MALLKWKCLQKFSCTLLLVTMSACNSDNAAPASAVSEEQLEEIMREAQPIIEEELAKEDARSAVRFPCTLLDREAASALLGAELEAPAFAFEHKAENDMSWQAEACSWNSLNEGPDLSIWVSQARHFADGHVQCIGIRDEDVPEPLAGGQGVWDFQASFAWSRLLVCREDALFFIEIHDGPEEEAAARRLTLDIAEKVTTAL